MHYKSVELFSGAGGLALGLTKAGFHHEVLIEQNPHACQTLRANQHSLSESWKIAECDARTFDFKLLKTPIDLVAGGPPCQPFSLGGKHKGINDGRDMFPVAIKAVRELGPKAFVFENVKGLLRQSFEAYLQYISLQLSSPDLIRYVDEIWPNHLVRLAKKNYQLDDCKHYTVSTELVNAADYGVPQKRERLFIVGFQSDLNIEWVVPKPTHSEEALLWSKWVTGDYWEEHEIAAINRPLPSDSDRNRVQRLKDRYGFFGPTTTRWRTVRDAIAKLPDDALNHELRAGAKLYPGHTGSGIDEPAKALKAGDHGVPGGENMIRYYDGSVRYFSVRESCRLQTFPDDFYVSGSWTEGMRQIGNAVPVRLATMIGRSIGQQLDATRTTIAHNEFEFAR